MFHIIFHLPNHTCTFSEPLKSQSRYYDVIIVLCGWSSLSAALCYWSCPSNQASSIAGAAGTIGSEDTKGKMGQSKHKKEKGDEFCWFALLVKCSNQNDININIINNKNNDTNNKTTNTTNSIFLGVFYSSWHKSSLEEIWQSIKCPKCTSGPLMWSGSSYNQSPGNVELTCPNCTIFSLTKTLHELVLNISYI